MLCACGCGQETPISKYTRKDRGYKKGEPQKYIRGHDRHTGAVCESEGYLFQRREFVHRAEAKKTTGGELPPGAIVHHINGDKKDNRPENLMICNNRAEHSKIHMMERAEKECGHADWRKCSVCKKWDDPNAMTLHGRSFRHKECHRIYEMRRRLRIKCS
jgi:hypothetical protein